MEERKAVKVKTPEKLPAMSRMNPKRFYNG
jgi:hypothetical protein